MTKPGTLCISSCEHGSRRIRIWNYDLLLEIWPRNSLFCVISPATRRAGILGYHFKMHDFSVYKGLNYFYVIFDIKIYVQDMKCYSKLH